MSKALCILINLFMHPQLPLSLGLKDSAVFANFVPDANAEALAYLQGLSLPEQAATPCVYLWGGRGSGKSHLLQALCHAAGERDRAAVYLPMQSAAEFPCEVVNGLEDMEVICIDDIQAIAGQAEWERALLRLFESIQQARSSLVVTGCNAATELGLQSQLASRLAWGMSFQLKDISSTAKREALQLRAKRRGLKLPQESTRFLVRHFGGDLTALFNAFDRLDKASLAEKSKLTLPFIRRVLELD